MYKQYGRQPQESQGEPNQIREGETAESILHLRIFTSFQSFDGEINILNSMQTSRPADFISRLRDSHRQ